MLTVNVCVILNIHTANKDHFCLFLQFFKDVYFFPPYRMITLTDELIATKLKHAQVSIIVWNLCYHTW